MKRAHTIAAVFAGLTFLINALIIVSSLDFGLKIYLTQVVFVTLLHVTAAIILVLAIKGFRDRIKTTYLLICGSMLMIVFGLLQDVALQAVDATDTVYTQLGGTMLPYVVMMFLAYFGMRLLAKQLLVESILLKPWLVIGTAVLVATLAVLIPTPRTDLPEYVIDIETFVYALVVLLIAVTALAVKTVSQASTLYKSALRWTGIYFGSVAVVTTANLIAQIYLPGDHWFWAYGVSYSVYNFTAVAAVVAALKFTRIAFAPAEIIKTVQRNDGSAALSDSVDIIMSLAQLASNPRSISLIMDDLRRFTSSIEAKDATRALNDGQQIITAHIYQQLESYLVDKEPVGRFTTQQLRQMIEIRFKDTVQEPTFWKTTFKH